jgi:transposase
VQELEARLAKNSTNSSRPPSSDPPSVKKQTRSLRQQSGKRARGQPQHCGSTLKQVRKPDEVVVHSPAQCRGCGESLAAGRVTGCERRQVFDLPRVKLLVTEHQVLNQTLPQLWALEQSTVPRRRLSTRAIRAGCASACRLPVELSVAALSAD